MRYATSNGTATAGTDYTATSGTLTIPAGSLYGFISVPVVRDAAIEGNETFSVTLSSPSTGTAIATGTATGTILNDDVTFAIAATSASKLESNVGTTPFTFTVTRTGDSERVRPARRLGRERRRGERNRLHWRCAAVRDGELRSRARRAAAITVNVAGDKTVEANEAFAVTLSNPSTEERSWRTATAGGTIRNDDARLSIAAASASKAEGQSGSTPFTFTVTRTGDTSVAHSAHWAVGGAAVTGADFAGGTLPSGTVSFAAGQTSRTITVNVVGDKTVEANEALTVTLSSPSTGATLGMATATSTILNDDAPTALAIAATDASKAEGNSGTRAFNFTVTRTGSMAGASSAHWAVSGSAVSAADFAAGALPAGTVTFAAGETSRTITVGIAGDFAIEANETFTVSLSGASAGTTIAKASAIGTILNDDASSGSNTMTGTPNVDSSTGSPATTSSMGWRAAIYSSAVTATICWMAVPETT